MARIHPRRRSMNELEALIERLWDERDSLGPDADVESHRLVGSALNLLDSGSARIADWVDGRWQVNQWLKKAVLLSFRLNRMEAIAGGPGAAHWWDKVPSKFADWGPKEFAQAGFRAVPGSIVRRGAFIASGVVLMPSFVN